jgi:hypothetical protein
MGYYGPELDGYYFTNSTKCTDEILNYLIYFNNSQDIDKIKHVLNLEYGYMLDSLKSKTLVEIKTLKKDDLIIGNPDHYFKITISDNLRKMYTDIDTMMGIVIEHDGKYRLIDGYHRYKSNEHKNEFDYIILK